MSCVNWSAPALVSIPDPSDGDDAHEEEDDDHRDRALGDELVDALNEPIGGRHGRLRWSNRGRLRRSRRGPSAIGGLGLRGRSDVWSVIRLPPPVPDHCARDADHDEQADDERGDGEPAVVGGLGHVDRELRHVRNPVVAPLVVVPEV